MDKMGKGLMQKIQHEREKKTGIDEQSNKYTVCTLFPL